MIKLRLLALAVMTIGLAAMAATPNAAAKGPQAVSVDSHVIPAVVAGRSVAVGRTSLFHDWRCNAHVGNTTYWTTDWTELRAQRKLAMASYPGPYTCYRRRTRFLF